MCVKIQFVVVETIYMVDNQIPIFQYSGKVLNILFRRVWLFELSIKIFQPPAGVSIP